ncbi:MAG TPA: hypothetical protein VGI50_02030 [Solirubrobacteraceae bacterium]
MSVNSQPERREHRRGLGDERFGVPLLASEHDNEVVGLCRVPGYAVLMLGSLVVVGVWV